MTNSAKIHLPEDRYFDPDPRQKEIALRLYREVADKPLVCPHGHVDPRMFANPDFQFGSPADLLLIPDHYIFRMLYSQGIPMESLGIPRVDGGAVETDHRKIWRTFAENFHLFRGTPTGMWLAHELSDVFGVDEKLGGERTGARHRQRDHPGRDEDRGEHGPAPGHSAEELELTGAGSALDRACEQEERRRDEPVVDHL